MVSRKKIKLNEPKETKTLYKNGGNIIITPFVL